MDLKIPSENWIVCWPCREYFKCPKRYKRHKGVCKGVKENPNLIFRKESVNPQLSQPKAIETVRAAGDEGHLSPLGPRSDPQGDMNERSRTEGPVNTPSLNSNETCFDEILHTNSRPDDADTNCTLNSSTEKPDERPFDKSPVPPSDLFSCHECNQKFRLRIQLNQHRATHHATGAEREPGLRLRILINLKLTNDAGQLLPLVPETSSKSIMGQKHGSTKSTTSSRPVKKRKRRIIFGTSSRKLGKAVKNTQGPRRGKAKRNHDVESLQSCNGQPEPRFKSPGLNQDKLKCQRRGKGKRQLKGSSTGTEARNEEFKGSDGVEQTSFSRKKNRRQPLGSPTSGSKSRTTQIRSFECQKCKIKFRTKQALVAHKCLRQVSKKRKAGNSVSTVSDTKSSHRRQGKEAKRPFQCDKCDKSYSTRWGLSYHLFCVHFVGQKGFSCSFCDRKYPCKSHLVTHMKSHTGSRGMWSCDNCGKRYKRKSSLSLHKKTPCLRKHQNQ